MEPQIKERNEMNNKTINPFRWVGNKHRYLDKIYKYVDEHDIFVDVFGGSGSVIINKPIKANFREIYNDLDGIVVNYFRVVRDNEKYKELMRLISLTPFHPKEFEEALNMFNNKEKYEDIDLAWAFLVSIYMSYNAQRRKFTPNFSRNTSLHRMSNRIKDIHNNILNILFFSYDYRELFNKLNNRNYDIIFFLDPPYITKIDNYNCEMKMKEEHEEFVNILLEYGKNNPKYKFILTSYENEVHQKLLENKWNKEYYLLENKMAIDYYYTDKLDCIYTSPNIKINNSGLFNDL